MRTTTLALAAGLWTLPASGHEAAGRHGGRVADAGVFHVELVTRPEGVDVYLSDAREAPVPVAGFRGTAILVVAGKPARIPLVPAEGNRLSGRAALAPGERPRGAVQITAPDGATASGSFR
ncbi:hypothetical protein [Methylobacterium planeticum]|uniref:Copper chaperone PCu(A)C n=1 Tax=Methylobacterium planeticum TaxID=2615211 RepID=A0A6N6MN69_9HYPH|nr:hypothetical protein [Methylobacterium planeticum]KAB1071609.1 hypothetical protein F6X51_18765 [Methylobacterium planeticum]